jgi:hypothetical protein
MNYFRLGRSMFVLSVAIFCFVTGIYAQENASSSSVSRSRAIVNSNQTTPTTTTNTTRTVTRTPTGIKTTTTTTTTYQPTTFTPPDEVAVEEFVNYHKHRLALPKVGQAVAMDTRWGNNVFSVSQREAVLQIGFTTAEVNERTDLRPLNLSLVIDKSGSMADSDKMSRVKESLLTMISKLRPDDIVSIVVFDTDAQVLFPAGRIGDGYELRQAINYIEPGGSTNLHAGLLLGYREAKKNYRQGATNRVILLTDGIANVGVIEPTKIAAESSEYNGQGIDLSTIGVGLDLNNDLLRTLAKSGRGLYHFISDYQDIDKVFVNEVQSLISSVARKVDVNVDYDPNLSVEKIYGYAPRYRNNGFSIGLDDMNNGLTQVIMVRFRAKDASKNTNPVKVRLSYFDIKRQKTVEEIQEVSLSPVKQDNCELLADVEVKKNYTIAQLAQSLYEMTQSVKNKNYYQAETFVNNSITEAYKRFPNMEDKDIKFILNIVENYQRELKAFNQGRVKEDCGKCN